MSAPARTPAPEAMTLETLALALQEERLEPAFQPIARLGDGALAGFEALARLRGRDGGLILPAAFLETAFAGGLMAQVSSRMLAAGAAALGRWRAGFPQARGLFVAVNVSGRDLERVEIVAEALQARLAADLPAGALKLEITEHQVVRDPALARRTLGLLRESGVAIAFDDFGAGFNALRWLAELPADTLKIDQSFVRDIETHPPSAKIVRALIALAHDLGLDVVAEGVESEAVRERLAVMGCDYAQGLAISPPLSAADAQALIADLAAAPGARAV